MRAGCATPRVWRSFPGTDDLWVAVNNRDDVPYPFQDATGHYGQIVPAYVDNHPPDELIRLRDGGNYGWPFCNPDPDRRAASSTCPSTATTTPTATGPPRTAARWTTSRWGSRRTRPRWASPSCKGPRSRRPGPRARPSPCTARGISTTPAGDKVILVPFVSGGQQPSSAIDLVTGWTGSDGKYWGRPVDVAVDPRGGLLISDDASGTVYRLTRGP